MGFKIRSLLYIVVLYLLIGIMAEDEAKSKKGYSSVLQYLLTYIYIK